MNTYIYANNSFAKVSSYCFSDNSTEILTIEAYHYDTQILTARIGNTDNEPSAMFTACSDIGKFSRSDLSIINLAISKAIEIAKHTKENAKALKEILHLINRNKFNKWYSDFTASNGVKLSIAVWGVTKPTTSRIKSHYLAIQDNTK